MIVRKSKTEIETMGRAGRVVASTFALLGGLMKPGVTTAELDEAAEEHIRAEGGVPTFKGYRGFPASICVSPNSMVVHGIPGPYTLREGDLISVDVGVTLDGFVADAAYTFAVGEVDGDAKRLLDVCQAALRAGIEQARAGNHVQDISAAVQRVVEEAGARQAHHRGHRARAQHDRGQHEVPPGLVAGHREDRQREREEDDQHQPQPEARHRLRGAAQLVRPELRARLRVEGAEPRIVGGADDLCPRSRARSGPPPGWPRCWGRTWPMRRHRSRGRGSARSLASRAFHWSKG